LEDDLIKYYKQYKNCDEKDKSNCLYYFIKELKKMISTIEENGSSREKEVLKDLTSSSNIEIKK
jgi:hypothetical protein